MKRSIQAAAVQMDVQPAPTSERMDRAAALVREAAQQGATLVALPELFNTGYTYSDENFKRAEATDGLTVTWMKQTARESQVHLAGSLLVREGGEIYNALLLVAPDGRTWRYDKSFPWGYERAYFRPNRARAAARACVAETALGRVGMLICWDVAHADLWRHYAGQVDVMVICSCPPLVTQPALRLSNGETLTAGQLGPSMQRMKDVGRRAFVEMVAEQAAWLGVPVIHASACGNFQSAVPGGAASLLGFAASQPGLLRYLPQAGQVQMHAPMVEACQILSVRGISLARRTQASGEGLITAQVHLPQTKHKPSEAQPPTRVPRLAYLFSDGYLPLIMRTFYRRGLRQIAEG